MKLDGRSLTLDGVIQVAQHKKQVSIDSDAIKRMENSFQLVLEAALMDRSFYGVTVGTGWDKDRKMLERPAEHIDLTEDNLFSRSRAFNLDSLRAHATATGKPLSKETVRAGMLIRLNTFLTGESGIQPAIAESYMNFLNHDIVPVIPDCGSVGEVDLVMAAHIGLAMIGEWDVYYKGERIPAKKAMDDVGLKPIQPVGKDFLAIVATNDITVGNSVLAVHEAEEFLKKELLIFSLCLEGLNGNVSPFFKVNTAARPYPHMQAAADHIIDALEGSSLWVKDLERPLQDPLSYRSMAYRFGEVFRSIKDARYALQIEINHSGDNPRIAYGVDSAYPESSRVDRYVVDSGEHQGVIYPTANFNSLPFIAPVEQLLHAFYHVSDAVAMGIMRFADPRFTQLSRFLSSMDEDGGIHNLGFANVGYTVFSLNNQNRMLAQPVTSCGLSLAGDIEDTGMTGDITVNNLHQMIDNLYTMASIQLLHATQAVDLRRRLKKWKELGFHLGHKTQGLYDIYRKQVPFVDADRSYSQDIENGKVLLEEWSV